MHERPITPRSRCDIGAVIGEQRRVELDKALHDLAAALNGRRLWHVNSTGVSGGVAELLDGLLGYLVEAGVDVRWLVVDGSREFFTITKRLHNRLHGVGGDGGPLGRHERATYDETLRAQLDELDGLAPLASDDVVVLHDPQTVGLARWLSERDACVVWRCHIGVDAADALARSAWAFLGDDVAAARARVFSRREHIWEGVDGWVVPPCIDVVSAKNQPLDQRTVDDVLVQAGITDGDAPRAGDAAAAARISRPARLLGDARLPRGAPLVVQVSRWDRLKGSAQVVQAFAEPAVPQDAHLVVAGPADGAVGDDPEGAQAYGDVEAAWRALPDGVQSRVHIATLPMDDVAENALIVNALQRRADVVTQKSVVEGFGLTVAEAMWKQRAVVATRVGGIQDQIVDGCTGVLVDPSELGDFATAVSSLLADPRRRDVVGRAARQRVCECFLPAHHFAAEAALFGRVA